MAKGKTVSIQDDKSKAPVIKPTIIQDTPLATEASTQFRIYVGSYEHNLLCLSVILQKEKTPVFQSIFHFQAHSLSIKSIAAAKRYLVTGSNDEHIRIYDLQKRKELGTLMGHQGSITSLRFSNEGQIESTAPTSSTANTTSGKWLLSGSEDGKLIIWRTKDWETFGTLKGHTGRVNDIAIHPSGRIAVSVGDDKTVRLWNLMTAKKAANLRIKKDWQNGEMVRWSIDGEYFFVGLLNQILIYKTSEAAVVGEVAFKSTLMHMEIYEINGVEYALVGLNSGSLEFYQVKDLINGGETKPEPEFVLQGHTNRVKDFKLYKHNDDETYLISISSDGSIVIWDMKLKDQVAVYNTGERLNCVEVTAETVEKADTMKRRYNDIDEAEASASESEAEDAEELKRIMNSDRKKKNKKSKKAKKEKITVELE